MVSRPSFRRSGAAMALAVLLTAGVLTGCQVAKVGAKCKSGFGRNSTHVLVCKNGKWARLMTIADYLKLLAAQQNQGNGGSGGSGGTGGSGGSEPPPVGQNPVPVAWSLVSTGDGDGVGYASTLIGSRAYVGGAFSSVTDGTNVRPRGGVAAFDKTTGALVEAFVADTNGVVKAMATDGSYLYIGGTFTVVNGQPRQYLAKLDPNTGAVVPWAQDANDKVYALAMSSTKLYVGGAFDQLGGLNRRRAAAIDLASGAVDSQFNPVIGGGSVNAIDAAPNNSAVYVGGSFTLINSASHQWLAKLSASGTVQLSGNDWQGLNSGPLDVEVASNGELLVALGEEENQAARYRTDGSRIWQYTCIGDAQAIHEVNGVDYAGFHQSCEGDKTYHLIKINGVTGGIDQSFKPTISGFWGPYSISGDASALIVTGDFPSVNGNARRGFVIFNPAP